MLLTALCLTGFGAPAVSAAPQAGPTPAPAPPSESVKASPQGSALSPHSAQLLTDAEVQGKKWVTVMALTPPGGTTQVADKIRSLGGSVGYRQDKVGYLRAAVPTSKVAQAAALAGVEHMDLDEMLALPRPNADPATKTSGSLPWTGPNDRTPADNPYLPTGETGAVAFKAQHPDYDGRGVTVGVLDSGVDLDHPALQTTSTGERKITDWVTATDPLLEADATWRPMLTRVTGPSATYGGATWKLPAREGDYAMNAFSESAAAKSEDIGGDVNRDGDKTDSWGVLYDYRTNDIWVDVDQNHEFSADELMRPYAEKHQVGHFGVDDPKTAVSERMPFVVEFRKDVDLTPAGLPGRTTDYVNVGVIASAHGTHVAGITAGHKLFGGVDGAAPGAKIVSAKACVFAGGCTAVALTEGMIDLVANKHVDVVNMSIGGLPPLNDANNTRSRLYDRLIDTYGVQLFISAGNEGPGANTIGDPSVASDVVSVAASASKNTWKANYGADATAPLWAQNYSSRGPREDGGFKPNIMAPGSAISSIPIFMKAENVPQVSYSLPPGYSMYNGTSMAAPEATGGAALLLSAGRATDLPIRPKQLRESIYSSAKFVPGVPAAAQGNGQIDVVGAWSKLSTNPAVDSAYTISAPVCTPLADLLATKNRGTGIYNRCSSTAGGQDVGTRKTYDVTITRTAGAAGASAHTLRWVGDDGTFDSMGRVDLPLGRAVTVPVSSAPRGLGLHSAILEIDSPATPLVDARMMAAVAVSTPLTSAPYTEKVSSSVQRVRTVSYFVDVPEKAGALQVDLSGIAAGSQVRFQAMNPYGVPVDAPTAKATCYTNDVGPKICNPVSRAYKDPMPGVWEVQIEAKRTTPFTTNPFTIAGSVQGTTVTPATQTIPTATIGTPVPVSWTVRNEFADATVHGEGGPLGSARILRPSIAKGEARTFTVDVPAGAKELTAAIGNTSDATADLDLIVYDASGAIVGTSAKADSEEKVTIPSPKPGTYKVEVDGYDMSDASTQYDYLDVFTSPGLGSLDVAPTPATLTKGATTTIKGSLTARTAVAEGRKLTGTMSVVSDKSAVLGTGTVVVEKVEEAAK